MDITIVTPTHRPSLLVTPRDSLKNLDIPKGINVSWLIYVNNSSEKVPVLNVPDVDVRVVYAKDVSDRVGEIKQRAFLTAASANPTYLLELDHDDQLHPEAIVDLATYAAMYKTPGFIYSDAVHINYETGESHVYSGKYGWQPPYDVEWHGEAYETNAAFPVTAAALYNIFFSPDHFRCWRTDVYRKLGGHNPDLSIADDHELLIRTYLAGEEMVHIPKCLYFYTLQADGSNTYLERNQAIQYQQAENGDKYKKDLWLEWCRREDLHAIELGAFGRREDGVKTVSLSKSSDYEFDVRRGLPWEDNSVGYIEANDFLEHIPHCRDSTCKHGLSDGCVVFLMNEIHRVLAPGGLFTSHTPSTGGRGAFQDPTHCSFWNPNSFWYYINPVQKNFIPGSNATFIAKKINEYYPGPWYEQHDILYVDADLVCLKGDVPIPGNNEFWSP